MISDNVKLTSVSPGEMPTCYGTETRSPAKKTLAGSRYARAAREATMGRISRRQFVGGAATAAATAVLPAPSVRAQKDAQTLRFIAEANL